MTLTVRAEFYVTHGVVDSGVPHDERSSLCSGGARVMEQ